MLRLLLVSAGMLMASAPVFAADSMPKDSFGEPALREMSELIERQQCDDAWDLVWTYAKGGSSMAKFAILVGAGMHGALQVPWPRSTMVDVPVPADDDPDTVRYIQFLADVAFSLDIRRLDVSAVEDAQGLRQIILESAWNPDVWKRYEQAGCFSKTPKAICLDSSVWQAGILSLSYWDTEIAQYRKSGLKADCGSKRPEPNPNAESLGLTTGVPPQQ